MARKRSKAKTLAFIVGGVVGAVGGLLFAPRPGSETREQLKQRADELMEEGRERYGDQCGCLRDIAVERGEGIKDKIEEAREKLLSGVESATQAVKEKINSGAEFAQDVVSTEEEKTETQ